MTAAGRGRRPRRRSRVWTASGALLLAAGLFLIARPGTAYRFYWAEGFPIPPAAQAFRWGETDFPLEFRLLENNLEPGHWAPGFLRSVIEEAFAAWNAIPTSTARVELVRAPWPSDRTGKDGIHQIGFSAELDTEDQTNQAVTEIWRHVARGIYECDIPMHPRLLDVDQAKIRSRLLYVVMHELGHCLGLHHSEPYPMSDWVEGVPSTFSPPPLMSYSWSNATRLADDDRVGVSLLYPTAAFTRLTGAVGGRVMLDGVPAPFVYVQALRPDGQLRAGPGTFAGRDGQFVLEGLAPGPVLLWVHPMLVHVGHPHAGLFRYAPAAESVGEGAMRDQWRWVRVTAGETLAVPDIIAVAGRTAASR